MKRRIKLFEDFKQNNISGDLIEHQDILDCIKSGGVIYADIIKNYKHTDPEEPLKPITIDNDGLIMVSIDGLEYYVDIENVNRIELP
jgi:hypothetical protein